MTSSSARLLARKYRWKYAGMLGYLIQRVTGIGLLVYLFLHVHTIHELRIGPGITVGRPLTDFEGVLAGIVRRVPPPSERTDGR